MAFNLPEKVQKLTVCIDDKELGVLTHDAIHDYKQTQNEFNLSLTMTEKGMDDSYRSGALHPIFALQYTPDMSNIFVSPPFDITHTLIYPTINNKMALNICKSKEFPDCEHLIKLANQGHIVIRNAQEIVESLAQGIIEYVSSSQEVLLLSGLKESILAGVDKVMTATYSSKSYRHDKKKKFE